MSEVRRYRPSIPWPVKLQVVLQQKALCGCGCGEPLEPDDEIDFDHDPALIFRDYDEETRTYTPGANDPAHILAKRREHHKKKTFGPGGEKRITTRGSDIGELARSRRISKNQAAFRQKLLAKTTGEPDPDVGKLPKRKQKIPSRPFPSGRSSFQKRSKK